MTENNKDDFPLPFPERKPYGYFEESLQVRALHIYLSDVIEEPNLYTDLIHKIRTAGPNDVVHIYLNTPGGHIDTGVQIINAIENTQGLVYTHLDGSVCSMGSLIFLAGHQMVAYDHSIMMFHNYSGGAYGKGHEIKSMLDAQERWYDKLQERLLVPFLTEDELARIKKGEDIWMHYEEIIERLEHLQKLAEEREAAELEALEKELREQEEARAAKDA